jgi:hypothetical protein
MAPRLPHLESELPRPFAATVVVVVVLVLVPGVRIVVLVAMVRVP